VFEFSTYERHVRPGFSKGARHTTGNSSATAGNEGDTTAQKSIDEYFVWHIFMISSAAA
jgi:hypothetical protein